MYFARDLAARNILIDEHKTLKISDFGLSRSGIYVNTKNKVVRNFSNKFHLNFEEIINSIQVPLRWLSIEAMRDHLFSDKSDVWAFGVVLWEIGALGKCSKFENYTFATATFIRQSFPNFMIKFLFSGGHPYHTVNNDDLPAYLSAGNRLEKPDNCSSYLYELMKHCWAFRPDDRPDFNEILRKLEPLNQRIYTDFSEISSDYVFPPTKEEIQNNKLSNGLRHIEL